MNDMGIKLVLYFQKRMQGITELTADYYSSALKTAITDLEELKKGFGTPAGFDEDDWVIAYATARLFITLGYIRGMYTPIAMQNDRFRMTSSACFEIGGAEQKELCSMFEKL